MSKQPSGRLKAALDSRIKAVGVFVNAPVGSIVNLCTSRVIDLVQLHGDENEGYVEELKHKIDCPLIKAVRVQSPAQVLQAEQLPCDLLLLEIIRLRHDSCSKKAVHSGRWIGREQHYTGHRQVPSLWC